MALMSIQFQLDDQESVPVNLPASFTLGDFKKSAAGIYDKIHFYSFICHGKALSTDDESKFNQEKALITSGTTIFVEKRTRGCFLSDTLVRRADMTEIPISDVQLGDVLLAFTGFGQIVTTIVEQIFIYEVDEYIEMSLGQNRLQVTREHPFFIGNGIFCSLDKLSINDCVYNFDNDNLQSIPITDMKVIVAPTTRVYNLHTTQPHTYFANGIAVHNKFGQLFVDLTDTSGLQRITWGVTAPNWYRARPGICLEGKCNNKNCKAYDNLVIINLGIRRFDFFDENNERTLKCPECSEYVGPTTCAFNNCYWRYEGRVQHDINTPPKPVSGDWKHADNAYHRFNENISGTVRWLKLILEATAKIN